MNAFDLTFVFAVKIITFNVYCLGDSGPFECIELQSYKRVRCYEHATNTNGKENENKSIITKNSLAVYLFSFDFYSILMRWKYFVTSYCHTIRSILLVRVFGVQENFFECNVFDSTIERCLPKKVVDSESRNVTRYFKLLRGYFHWEFCAKTLPERDVMIKHRPFKRQKLSTHQSIFPGKHFNLLKLKIGNKEDSSNYTCAWR